jgi:predicted  nucleic acid-binding Zn-ribbon protein
MGDLKETLWALGVCDEMAGELERERTQIPASIEELERKAQAAKDVIAQERNMLEEAEHTRRSKEGELQDCEAKRSKFQGQTAMVKTNAEYTALLSEVDGMTARISQLEEEILLSMETADQVSARLKTVESEQTKIEQDLLGQAQALRERMEVVKQEIAAKDTERVEQLAHLSPNIVASYQRLRGARGQAMARIEAQSCAACHRQVPPETINRVLAGELHTCQSCLRILLVDDS